MSTAKARPANAERQPTAAKPLLDVLCGASSASPPVWLMRQAGRYLPEYRALRAEAGSFLELCYTPALAAEATLQPVRRFGMDGAILFSDILVVPHALGMALEFREGEGPVLAALRGPDDVAALDGAGVTAALAPVYEAVSAVRAAMSAETTLIGFAGAPWTVASYMLEGGSSRDFVTAKRWMWQWPDAFAALIDRLVEATVAHLAAQVEAGAEAVQIFDSWAGALGDGAFEAWSAAPIRRIVEGVKARFPDVPVIAFPRGAGARYAGFAAATGADAVSLDTGVPVPWAVDAIVPPAVLQGNLDPVTLLVGGDALREGIGRIREAMGRRPFVFNLGHGVLPETPPEHVAELVARVRS